MPNWCSNDFSIEGPKDKIEALYNNAIIDEDDGGGLLQAMVPMPDELKGTLKGSGEEKQTVFVDGTNNWWDWRVHYWGTKWEVSTEGFEGSLNAIGEDRAEITGWFESAWAPPIECFSTYCKANSDVKLKLGFHEPGMCFVGDWSGSDGEPDDINEYDYSNEDSRSVRKVIGGEMDDHWLISESMAEYEADELEYEAEEVRRDQKKGLYAQHQDDCN